MNEIQYSKKGKSNISLFYTSYQERQFYIEDEKVETQHAFKIILNKLFEERFQIRRVFPLGNKTKVLEKSRINTDSNSYFLIDRDMDPYLENYINPRTLDNVIELERYCFENYLIEKKSFEETIGFYISQETGSEYDKWLSEVIVDFEKVFKIALVSRKYNLTSCITDKEYVYLINNTHKLSGEKVGKLYDEKKSEVTRKGYNFDEEFQLVEEVLTGVDIKNQLVSGKFLWASLTNYCKNLAKATGGGKGMTDKALFTSFVQSIDLKNFEFLKERVL
ncbi:MAG TPA: DUF4435 domain-containing protein [Sporosarcina psychrophila]|uniref:DUF4435 domain-containing protein n=1 Tax=Sporosarcina psychrophila TaxID=1476 RepID=A0A921G3Q7_SPOPS|nr:DUF4435 domain-containing protein [Sporosarcina psychrophila]